MNRVTPPIRQLATRLIIHDMSEHASSATAPANPFQVCQKLRPQVATLMGNSGFRALLTRALALGRAEIPWLSNVHVNAEGTLEVPDQQVAPVEPDQLIERGSVVLAELVGLMVAFIGPALTLNMVREVWPEIRLDESDFFIEGSHENAK